MSVNSKWSRPCRPNRRRTASPDSDRTADRRFSRRPRIGGGPWRCTSATSATFWRAKPSTRASKANGPDACRPVFDTPSRPVSAPMYYFYSNNVIVIENNTCYLHRYCSYKIDFVSLLRVWYHYGYVII